MAVIWHSFASICTDVMLTVNDSHIALRFAYKCPTLAIDGCRMILVCYYMCKCMLAAHGYRLALNCTSSCTTTLAVNGCLLAVRFTGTCINLMWALYRCHLALKFASVYIYTYNVIVGSFCL